MESIKERVNRLSEDSIAREKARVEKFKNIYHVNSSAKSPNSVPDVLAKEDPYLGNVNKTINNTKMVLNKKKFGNVTNNLRKQKFALRKDNMSSNIKVHKNRAVMESMLHTGPQYSVFERLYKPKYIERSLVNDVEQFQVDPNFLKKVIYPAGLIMPKPTMRRSVSVLHIKHIGKYELTTCIKKYLSVGDKLNSIHLKHTNEDNNVNDEVVSAIRSERQKVKFMTPMANFNTQKSEELQTSIKSWLARKGKCLDSYQNLQCFGICHLPYSIKFDTEEFDEDCNENIPVESSSDDDSYTEKNEEDAICVSNSTDLAESHGTMAACSDVVVGVLKDLADLLKEGFNSDQGARWLRAIREHFPSTMYTGAYWECRAALEEARGDLIASVHCWEEAISYGTETAVVEANLDQLLDKFIQFKICLNSGKQLTDPKFVDMKNLFKSTIIRFALQKAKL